MYFDARLWRFTEGVRGQMALSVALGFAASVFAIGRLAMLGWLIARIYQGAPAEELAALTGAIIVVVLLRGVLQYAKDMVAHRTAGLVQGVIRRRLYDHLVLLGPAFVNQERSGDVTLSLVDGVEQLETYFGQYLPQVAIAALTPIALFGFMTFLDVPVATVFLVAALATLVAPSVFHRWNRRHALRRRNAYGSFAAEFLDAIQGLATLKAFGQSRERGRRLAERAREVFRTTMWVLASNALTHGITVAGIAIGAAVALAIGAMRVVDGEMALGTLVIILMLGTEAFRPLRELSTLLHNGMVGLSAAEGVARLLAAEPLVRDEGNGEGSIGELEPTISFENVTFAYPGGRAPTHTGLSFQVAAGERVAIVGPSGSGKSSIVRLLLRLYDPTEGVVSFGGEDLRRLPLGEFRKRIAVVGQDTFLFHGSVEENIRFGNPDASRADIEAAAAAANAHEFIRALPHGYATIIGERGIRLSGGQRQRIAIARAILRDAPVLVLDEALSSVDAENEWLIQEALGRLMQGRTTLIFAHRLSSVIDADRILALEGGRVAESGTHRELMQRRGAYWRLMSEQAKEASGSRTIDQVPEAAELPALAREDAVTAAEAEAQFAPTEAVLRAEGMGWGETMGVLLRLVAPWRNKLIATLLLGIARVVTLIGVGVAGGLTVAALKNGEPFGLYLAVLAVVAPMTAVLHWVESWVSHDVAFRLLAEMRIALFDKLDALAPAYLTRRRTGDLVGLATQDVELVEYFFAHTIAPAFVAILVPGAVVATLLAFGWPLAVALLPFLLAVGIGPILLRRRVDEAGSRSREALAELNAHAVDTAQGVSEIVAFGQEARRGRDFDALGRSHLDARMPFFRDLTLQKVTLDAATGLGGLAVVVTGAVMVSQGSMDSAVLPLLTLLAMASFLPVSEIGEVGRRLADTLAATRRLYGVHKEPVPVQDGPGVNAARRDGSAAAVELDEVVFTYPGRETSALCGVSFAAPAGSTVAIVGPSGAGKTTVAQLLLRFWDPDSGALRIDGHDLREYRLDELRQRIALVAQDTYLFNDSLRSNILIAKPDATEVELEKALSDAALSDFVSQLPNGLDTIVGERGAHLSGGQRQRIAIARAFLKDAPILILDEATSHLDAVSELAVRRALDRLMEHRTTIVIAHRLSTIRNADMIVVMEKGRIAECGSHAALLAKGGLYAHLVTRQLAGAAAE